MVWGASEPSSFGDFSPNGDYVGWEEAIKRYFDEEMSAEQKAVFDNSHVRYGGEASRKFTEDRGALDPHERPLEFRMRETHKSLASLVLLADRLLAVDNALKEIIETLEPGVHQFWPMQIRLTTGREFPGSYHGLVIRHFIDSFVPGQSDANQTSKESKSFFAHGPTKKDCSKLTLSKERFGRAHLWRERWLRAPAVFLSDELQEAIARRGLRIWKHHQVKVI